VSSALPRVPAQIAVDSTSGPQQYVYWVDQNAGTVSKALTVGGAAAADVIVSGQSGTVGGIAVDSASVYWTSTTGLMKMPK
jgi:hypothetical protein